jgi:hypothetical protein
MRERRRSSSDRKSAAPRTRAASDARRTKQAKPTRAAATTRSAKPTRDTRTTRAKSAAKRRPAPPAEETKEQSPTAIAARALRTGLRPGPPPREPAIPTSEADTIRVGDPDDDSMRNEYSGEDTPGGSTPTPDQNDVDEIGRAYGLQEEDSGALQSAGEVLTRRDRRRQELRAPSKPRA